MFLELGSLVFEAVYFHMLSCHQHVQSLCLVAFSFHVCSKKTYLHWMMISLILLVEKLGIYETKNHRSLITTYWF